MAITKCLIWVPPVNRFTAAVKARASKRRASIGTEMSMSTKDQRELTETELYRVSGGGGGSHSYMDDIGNSANIAMAAWNRLLQQYGFLKQYP
jgi:hypothetical protein